MGCPIPSFATKEKGFSHPHTQNKNNRKNFSQGIDRPEEMR